MRERERIERTQLIFLKEMTVAYDYRANEHTKLKIWIPITLPGYGEASIPINVSGPRISGKVSIQYIHNTHKHKHKHTLYLSFSFHSYHCYSSLI
jgi:HSP20 family molecular chaperone IbpA